MTVKIKRLNDAVHMQATNEDGVSLQMDGIDRIGGINGGFRPMEMLLAAVGGCSAIDVVTILTKQRQNPDDLEVEVTGDRVEVEGAQYTEFKTIHIHFKLSGAHLDENKVARAIDLSLNKYCSVSKTLEKTATITSSFEIVG
jgi:putative redox protein